MMTEENLLSKPLLFISCLIGLLFIILGATAISGFGIALVSYSIGLLIRDSSSYFMPFELIIVVMSGLQWIVTPTICYIFGSTTYDMSVPESHYMFYTLVLYLPLYLTLIRYHSKRRQVSLLEISAFCSHNMHLIKIMIGTGLVFLFIKSQSFVVTLLSILYYIGIIMLMMSTPKKALYVMLAGLIPLLGKALSSAMFHDLLIWGLCFILALFFTKKYTIRKRITIFLGLMFMVVVLQSIKSQYRRYVWTEAHNGGNIEIFSNLMINGITTAELNQDLLSVNDRFNQGWIISRIYNYIPAESEYKGGKTIIEGVQTSLLPRFMSPTRKNKGEDSRKDFMEFTGVYINKNTSMGLSIIGESYGNFGLIGGLVFMIIWSQIVAWLFKQIDKLGSKNLLWICLLPMICFTLIKAETNFLSIINWTVKALFFAYIFIFFSCRMNLINLKKND